MSRPLLYVFGTLLVTQAAVIATSVYLHRGLAHRALTLHPLADWVFRFILWFTTGQNRREWVAVHRKHHAFTDTERDLVPSCTASGHPARERLLLRAGGPQHGDPHPLGQGHPERRVGSRSLQQGLARRRARHRRCHAGPRSSLGLAAGGDPLCALRLRPGPVHQRTRPLVGAPDLRQQLCHQSAGARHG